MEERNGGRKEDGGGKGSEMNDALSPHTRQLYLAMKLCVSVAFSLLDRENRDAVSDVANALIDWMDRSYFEKGEEVKEKMCVDVLDHLVGIILDVLQIPVHLLRSVGKCVCVCKRER